RLRPEVLELTDRAGESSARPRPPPPVRRRSARRAAPGGATGVPRGRTPNACADSTAVLHVCQHEHAEEEIWQYQGHGYTSAVRSSGGLWVKSFLAVVQVILAVLVMLGILLQTPKASGLGGTIGGGGDVGGGYRTKRGLEKNLFYATIGLVVLFVVVSVVYIRVTTHFTG